MRDTATDYVGEANALIDTLYRLAGIRKQLLDERAEAELRQTIYHALERAYVRGLDAGLTEAIRAIRHTWDQAMELGQ